MATQLSTVIKKNSTAIVTITFRDEDGQVVQPKSASWSLASLSGDIINGRRDVSITGLASTIQVVLSGADLFISKGKKVQDRVFSIKAIYDSILQDNATFNDSCIFPVENIVGS
jgi:hypothetical protein